MGRSPGIAFVAAAVLVMGAAAYWAARTPSGPQVPGQPRAPDAANAAVEQAPPAATPFVDTFLEEARARATAEREAAEWVVAARSTSGAITRALVATDPQAAAERSLDEPDSLQRLVANEWAKNDPEGLLAWARDRVGSERHLAFVAAAVRLQRRLDPDTAKTWILGMPGGRDRDILLTTLLTDAARSATAPPYFDPELFSAFDDDALKQRALLLSVHELAKRDPAATRALIDEHAVDPSTREQAEYSVAMATGRYVRGTTFTLGR